jgi:hypothetical protein
MTEFFLSDFDKATSLWVRLLSHFEDRLALARIRNDAPLTEAETAVLRGEIKALKALIRLNVTRPIVAGDEDQP